MSLDPNKTYLVWNGTKCPNSENATFKAPAGSTIDWGDGTVETFNTASTTVNTHTYTDGKTEHTIAISGLTSIDNDAFLSCSNLTSVVIGDNVTSIGSYAFYNCSSLTSVTIGNGVTSIGYSAFNYCSNLNSISVDENNQSYKSIDGNLYTKDGTTLIKYAIGKTTTLFAIPNNVTNIGDWAFSHCSSLTSITISNSITSIGNSAFSHCSSLTSIIIPDGVMSIGKGAFQNCSRLTSITVGNSVTSIGMSAFQGCSSLTSITIPNNVTSIDYGVFSGCSSLTSVTIGNSVTSIGDESFYECTSLTSVIIPNSVTSIGDSAFLGCVGLIGVVIGSGVTSISGGAFYDCSNLKQLILFPTIPPTLGSNAIPSTILKIYVQQSSKAAYQANTNWRTFAGKIIANNFYLSLFNFNQENKKYIEKKIDEAKEYSVQSADNKISMSVTVW